MITFSRYLLSRNLCLSISIRNVRNHVLHSYKPLKTNFHVNFFKPFTNLINGVRTLCNSADVTMLSKENRIQNQCTNCDYNDFSSLAITEEFEKMIKLILMEYEIHKQSGEKMPSTIKLEEMKELLQLNPESKRKWYLHYLYKKEMAKLGDQRKKERKRLEREQKEVKTGPKNTFFLMIRKKSMLKFYNSRLAHSSMFGSSLVIDMGYEEYMTKREIINCAEQISMAYGSNKINREPFDLHFCNLRRDGALFPHLKRIMPHINENNCLITITENNYLDMFSKQRIVYLTPNAPNVLQKFDHDSVYIVGGFVDKVQSKPISLAKAKQEGLKMAKLPLDHYMKWEKGTKSLTINQVMDIMLEIKASGNWNKAFKFVPTRKLCKINPEEIKNQRTMNKKQVTINTKSLFHD